MASEANVVEIDLVRAGHGLSMLKPCHVPAPYRTTYRASIWRSRAPEKLEPYAFTLRQSLPKIRIPLRATDMDVELDLQPLLDRVDTLSRFDRIDYSMPCEPPLDVEDAVWAGELIAKRVSQK